MAAARTITAVPVGPGLHAPGAPARVRLRPEVLAYLMGPVALVFILVARNFGAVAREPVWAWFVVFVSIPAVSAATETYYRRSRTRWLLHLRVAAHIASVTTVIYLSGWGPVLTLGFAFVALENIAHDGSETWRITTLWTLVGIAFGQLAVAQGWFPSFLSIDQSEVLGALGAFVVVFVIRMAGAMVEQKEAAESSMRASEDRFRSLVQNSSDVTLVVDEEAVIGYASPASQRLLGWTPEELLGKHSSDFIWPEDREATEAQLAHQLEADAVTAVQFRMSHADGSWRFVEAVVADLRDRPSVAGYVINIRDVTERKEAESLLAHQALHDPLTGLPNRVLILDRTEELLARSERDAQPLAAFFIDLDNFKGINDTLGHEAGDKLLQMVARRFSAVLRSSDTVGRLGGDEFVVLAGGSSLAAGPDLLAQRLHAVMREPFLLEGFESHPLDVSISVGIATGARPTAQDLLRDADTALYRAKAAGKNRSATFEASMHSDVAERLSLEMDLRSAVNNGQFFLLYQPVFGLDEITTRGVEALLRWQHPTEGVIPPDRFIPLLEETGMIIEVGQWVLLEACNRAAAWHRRGFELTMSVNVSMRQLESPVLVGHVREALDVSGLDPRFLTIEITETALMRDTATAITQLTELKTLGVQLAIDDFGTGYSSLAYLRQFPVDTLKIDRSFIASMSESDESRALVHALVELGRALGLETLAEGIEDRAQLESLQRERCESGQGFLFSRPIAPEAVEALLCRAGTAVPQRVAGAS